MNEPNEITVHQVLHGYAQGHQQLSTSRTLHQRDSKLMLVLSDISGAGVKPGDDGYLTGYPLLDAKAYVLSRTWAAPEMPRPGCVWTHSLIIDFADLAVLDNPARLDALFRRPSSKSTFGYDISLDLADNDSPHRFSAAEIEFSRNLIVALYDKATRKVISSRQPDVQTDPAVLAIWAQQWPRLRRAFRFCTLSGSDRTADGQPFDLQFYAHGDRAAPSRFSEAWEADTALPTEPPWVDEALSDLVHPDTRGLRSFMRALGSDIDSGREAYKALCLLHAKLQTVDEHPDAISSAMSLLDDQLGPIQARTARSFITAQALKQQNLSLETAEFVLRNLDLVDEGELQSHGTHVGAKIWEHDPERFCNLIDGTAKESLLARTSFATFSDADVIEGIRRSNVVGSHAIELRPQLVRLPTFWAVHGHDARKLFEASKAAGQGTDLIQAVILSGRRDLVRDLVRSFSATDILRFLAERWTEAPSTIELLRDLTWDKSQLAGYLSNAASVPMAMLSQIAKATAPDAVPNDYGEDPWLTAFSRASATSSDKPPLYLMAYLLTRALGRKSRNQADLLTLTFSPVYAALEANVLPDDGWRLVDGRLPWTFAWRIWDRCDRLAEAVADVFVDRSLFLSAFINLTDNETAFTALVHAASKSMRGERFLDQVLRELSPSATVKRRVIDQARSQWS